MLLLAFVSIVGSYYCTGSVGCSNCIIITGTGAGHGQCTLSAQCAQRDGSCEYVQAGVPACV